MAKKKSTMQKCRNKKHIVKWNKGGFFGGHWYCYTCKKEVK